MARALLRGNTPRIGDVVQAFCRETVYGPGALSDTVFKQCFDSIDLPCTQACVDCDPLKHVALGMASANPLQPVPR